MYALGVSILYMVSVFYPTVGADYCEILNKTKDVSPAER